MNDDGNLIKVVWEDVKQFATPTQIHPDERPVATCTSVGWGSTYGPFLMLTSHLYDDPGDSDDGPLSIPKYAIVEITALIPRDDNYYDTGEMDFDELPEWTFDTENKEEE